MVTLLLTSHRTDYCLISNAVAGLSSWNALPVNFKDLPHFV